VDVPRDQGVWPLTGYGSDYTPEHGERLRKIHARLIEARRELDALIGDAYLRPRANIVPVHFLDLASAVEKLRWAEKEWRELDQELADKGAPTPPRSDQKKPEMAGSGTTGSHNPSHSGPEEESEEPHRRGAAAEAVPTHSTAS
jgi:hypothetical protein